MNTKLTERKFVNLRKHLDQLGYRHALGIDSLPLVERLFADLIHTTDSLKKTKLALHKASAPIAQTNAEDIVEPYSKDNARLVQENNKLHLKCIELQDELDKSTKELKAKIIKLEHENSDLRFLNNQFVHKVRVLESETASKTESIQKLQEKNLQAVIQTPGGRKRTIPFRRQHMQIDCTLPSSLSSSYISSQPDDPYIADLLQVADTKIAQLAAESKKLIESQEICESKIGTMRHQIESRDREIERLNRSLEGGRPHDVLSLEAKNNANERLISHLNLQVDYLQQTSQDLELQMKEFEGAKTASLARQKMLENEVEQLKSEIRDIDHLARQLELEKKSAVATADHEIQEAQNELWESQKLETDLETRIKTAESSHRRLIEENENLHLKLRSVEDETEALSEHLNKVQNDKQLLGNQVKNLLSKEKELVMELEEYRQTSNGMRKREATPSRLDNFVRTLEQERDYYKNECDVLNSMLQKRERRSKGTPHIKMSSPRTKTDYKSGSEHLRDYEKVIQERDELQKMLDKFERHMAEIQANVRILTQERDKTNKLYEQTHDELQRTRRDAIRSPKSAKASLTAQAILRRVENERDEAISDLRRMTTERDTMREHIEILKSQTVLDCTKLEQCVSELSAKVEALEEEKNELQSRLESASQVSHGQEDDLKLLRSKLQEANIDREETHALLDEVKASKLQLESALQRSKEQLSKKSIETATAEDRVRVLETRTSDLLDTSSKQNEDVTGLRATVTKLDREKDSLQAMLDDKTERIAILEDQLAKRESLIMEQKVMTNNIENQLDRATEDLSSCDRELRSLRRQLDSTQTELAEAIRGKDVAVRENSRLQEDLATMTRENQDVNIELNDILRETEESKAKIKEYIMRIANTEGTITSKEREMQDLLEQYRRVAAERDSAEGKYRMQADEIQALKLEHMSAESEKLRLTEKASSLEREIMDHLQAQQIYESNLAAMTSNIQGLENEIQHINQDRTILAVDISSARDLNAKMDLEKEQLARQLTAKNVEYEQIVNKLSENMRETDSLRSQLENERSERRSIERLIASSREKEFQADSLTQETNNECQLLKDRLTLTDTKFSEQGREIMMLRSRASQLDADLEITKRQLTNERYEKERAVQELRKHGLPSPGTSRVLDTSSSPVIRPRSASPTNASYLIPK